MSGRFDASGYDSFCARQEDGECEDCRAIG